MSQASTSQSVEDASQPKPVKLNPPQFAKVGDLSPMQKEVNLVVRVVKLEAIASTNRNGAPVTVYECLLGDETGTIIFTARPNQLDLLKAGNLLVVRNAFVTIFKEYMRLRVDRWGSIRTYEDDASKVPADCQAPAVNAAAFSVNEDKAKNVSLTAYERVDDKNDNNGGDNNQDGNRRPPRRNNNNRSRNSRGGNNNGPRDGGDNNYNNSNSNNNGPRGRNNNRRNSNNDNNNNDNSNQYNSPSRRPNNNNRRQSGGNRNTNNNNNGNNNNNDNYNNKGGNRQGGNRDDNNRDGQPPRRNNNNRPPRRNNNNNNNNSNTNANTNN